MRHKSKVQNSPDGAIMLISVRTANMLGRYAKIETEPTTIDDVARIIRVWSKL